MDFLGSDYLLGSKFASKLYHETAEKLPIVDPHNHADVKQLAENKNISDPWTFFAGGDHYVWELLRKRGVPERLILGSASPREKWDAMCKVFPDFAGNPLYEWLHLDLKQMGLGGVLIDETTGGKIWDEVSALLATDAWRPRAIIEHMNVETMCSTDDPVDTLSEHDEVNRAYGRVVVRPTWRPDRLLKLFKPDWCDYVARLGKRWGREITDIKTLCEVMKMSHDYFAEHGAVASDHGMVIPPDGSVTFEEADKIFRRALAGEKISEEDFNRFSSCMMRYFGELDAEKNFVFQMHMGVRRDVRDSLKNIGPDTGGDLSDHMVDMVQNLCRFLNNFDDTLKVIMYCLDPGHQASMAAIARTFGEKVRVGAAWWLNDTPFGIRTQLEHVPTVDLFATYGGMVSDSRRLLSYSSRFEMFRRTLCDVVAEFVLRGQIPEKLASKIVRDVCYDEPKRFFRLA